MMSPFPAEYGTGAAASSVKSAILAANATGVVVRPEVSYLRVVGSFSHPVDRLSTEPVCVGSRLHKPAVYTNT